MHSHLNQYVSMVQMLLKMFLASLEYSGSSGIRDFCVCVFNLITFIIENILIFFKVEVLIPVVDWHSRAHFSCV